MGATLTAAAGAQDEGGQPLRGLVVDGAGGVIPGARVTLAAGGADARTTLTDAQGRFLFEGAPRGGSTVTVSVDHFATATVAAEAGRDLRVVLQPATRAEAITVRAPRLTVERSTIATRTDTPLRDVPQSVSVVTRELIADLTMQGIGDVVRYVPGVGIAQGEGNRDTPIFRGNSSTSDFFVDGVRDDVQYFRDLYNVERVEAVKGPNAMIFGRGGVGGVINRVVRRADWATTRELAIEGGSSAHRRLTGDLGQAMSSRWAARVTGLFENSDSYRDGVGLERYGLNPTVAVSLGARTTLRAGYEHFHDERTADRGIPSFGGRPVITDPSTFFGKAEDSVARADVDAVTLTVEHKLGGGATLRNHSSYGDYDKFYQNVFPGGVDATGARVNLSAYNNGMRRRNAFNQTDVVVSRRTGPVGHTLLAGLEVGRQETDNRRQTGFFPGGDVAAVSVPVQSPTTTLPVSFRPSATDADNHGVANVAAVYLQDQIALSAHVQAVVGLRYDRFGVDFHHNRTGADLGAEDGLVSPRVGLIYKPATPVSIYASYALSYLPRAGEQLSSLSLTNQALDPEEFRNYEIGAKWDLAPGLALTAATYRLDRGNVVVPDPVDPGVSLLVDGQRTRGVEVGLAGNVTSAWSLMGAYAYQDGEITRSISPTAAAGATLAQLPRHSLSLWNKYEVTSRWALGLGLIHRGEVFTSTDNTVRLPAFTRVDAAVFLGLTRRVRAQVNVENLLDTSYYAYAHNNNNITPGSPRALRVGLTTRF